MSISLAAAAAIKAGVAVASKIGQTAATNAANSRKNRRRFADSQQEQLTNSIIDNISAKPVYMYAEGGPVGGVVNNYIPQIYPQSKQTVINAEGGESILQQGSDGNATLNNINGPSHENGGTDIVATTGDFVFSNEPMQKKTMVGGIEFKKGTTWSEAAKHLRSVYGSNAVELQALAKMQEQAKVKNSVAAPTLQPEHANIYNNQSGYSQYYPLQNLFKKKYVAGGPVVPPVAVTPEYLASKYKPKVTSIPQYEPVLPSEPGYLPEVVKMAKGRGDNIIPSISTLSQSSINNNTLMPSTVDTTIKKNNINLSNDSNGTGWDALNYAGQLAGVGYNIYQSLKPDKTNPIYNPYEGQVRRLMANRRYNVAPQLAMNRAAQAVANRNIKNGALSYGQYLNNLIAANNIRNNADAQAWATKQNADNTYLGEEAQMLANLGSARQQANLYAQDANERNLAASRQSFGQAMNDISEFAQMQKLMHGQYNADLMRMGLWEDVFGNGIGRFMDNTKGLTNYLTNTSPRKPNLYGKYAPWLTKEQEG